MVKRFKLSLRIQKSTKKAVNSPEIELNSAPIVTTSSEEYLTEDFYSKFNNGVNLGKSNSNLSDVDSSGSSSCSDICSKTSSRDRRAKKLLREEGDKHITELIAYLHSDKPLVKTKFCIDREEVELLKSYDSAVDLDRFFEEKKPRVKDKLWRTPYFFTQRDYRNVCDCSSNGLHPVNRFGEGVEDGCSISLSLASKGRIFGDVFYRPTDWTDVFEEADKVLNQYENLGKRNNLKARRGSLLQPRFIFLSPHPEVAYERVLQSANCIPLRSWTSELFLDSKESSELMDSETKRNLKWNASVEDFRHLLSPELSHFGSDVYSMMIEAKRRMSLIPPKPTAQTIPFRRQSYFNGSVWTPIESHKHQKKNYEKKLGVIRTNSADICTHRKTVTTDITTNWLTVPEEKKIHNKSIKINGHFNTIDFLSIEGQTIEYSDLFNTSPSDISIEGLSSKQVANELTLIAKELFLSINSSEIIDLLIRPHCITPVSVPIILYTHYYIRKIQREINRSVKKLNKIIDQRVNYKVN